MLKPLAEYPLAELKLIYQALHSQIALNPQLMDAQFLDDLQNHLQQAATQDNVDISLHAEWSAWLNQN